MPPLLEQLNKVYFWDIDPKTLYFISLLLYIPQKKFK